MTDNRDQLTAEERDVIDELRRLYAPGLGGEVRAIVRNSHIKIIQVTTSREPNGMKRLIK